MWILLFKTWILALFPYTPQATTTHKHFLCCGLNKKIETWLNKAKNKLYKIQEPWLCNPNGIPYSSFCVSQGLVQGKLDLFQETLDTSVQATDKKSFSSGQHALDIFKC